MIAPRFITHVVFGIVLALPATGMVACGGEPKVVHSQVKPGDMPEGGDWTGVYYSEVYGNLHLTKEGTTISGCWRNTAGDEWGQMSGKVTGDVFHYEWHNQKIGQVGAAASQKGAGWFRYTRPKPGDPDVIKGEWGLGQNDSGDTWEGVKQQNVVPDCKKVLPDNYERGNVGGGWDDSGKPPAGNKGGDKDKGDDKGGDSSGGEDMPSP